MESIIQDEIKIPVKKRGRKKKEEEAPVEEEIKPKFEDSNLKEPSKEDVEVLTQSILGMGSVIIERIINSEYSPIVVKDKNRFICDVISEPSIKHVTNGISCMLIQKLGLQICVPISASRIIINNCDFKSKDIEDGNESYGEIDRGGTAEENAEEEGSA